MKDSRRRFLKVAGISALGIGTVSKLDLFAETKSEGHGNGHGEETAGLGEFQRNEKALSATQWAMVIDTTKIESVEDLEPMIEVCHKIHNVPDFSNVNKNHIIKWIWETEYEHAFTSIHSEYINDRVKNLPFLVLCNHCQNPPCVRACPTQATFKRPDGIVTMDFHRCIGCRFCMAACPFGSRSFNFRDPRQAENLKKETNPDFPTRMKGVVEKCNFCAERLAVGKMPACVEASNGILTFGDLNDPESEVRKLLSENYTIRRKQELGTEPCVYYIV